MGLPFQPPFSFRKNSASTHFPADIEEFLPPLLANHVAVEIAEVVKGLRDGVTGGERFDRIELLASNLQRCAGCREDLERGRRADESDEVDRGIEKVLDVVEHEQEPAVAEPRGEV